MLIRVIWHGPWSGMRRELALLVMDMRRTGRNAVREATARVERRGPKRSTAPPPDSHGGAAAAVGQPTPWTMCSGSVPPRGASGKRLSRKR
jgi:hypothetical protein